MKHSGANLEAPYRMATARVNIPGEYLAKAAARQKNAGSTMKPTATLARGHFAQDLAVLLSESLRGKRKGASARQ